MRFYYFLLLFPLSLGACQFIQPEPTEAQILAENDSLYTSGSISSPRQSIKTTKAQKRAFKLRSFSTGKLETHEKALIKFRASGSLLELPLKEGESIQEGSLIAHLEETALQLELQQRYHDLDEAIFKKKDLLIRNEGEANDDRSVSPEILKNILIQTGYNKINQSIKQVEYQIQQMKVFAPISGIVTDLKVKPFQQVSSGETICTILNPRTFEAVFTVLEKDAIHIKIGQTIRLNPTALPSKVLNATVSTIIPIVSKEGLVTIKAKLNTIHKNLFEGMNVEVAIEKLIPNQILIPKEALVLRSGREVVFVYDKETNTAQWRYVKIAYENDTQLAISEGIKAGEEVIIEGNLNLSHDAKVEIIQE